MHLDQKKVDFAYEDPVNGRWLEALSEYEYVVTFHPEILASRTIFRADHGSPFVASVGHFANYFEFRGHEQVRRQVREQIWPRVERAAVHFERGQWALFAKELRNVVPSAGGPRAAARVGRMFEATASSLQWFVFDRSDEFWPAAREQFEEVSTRAPDECTAFVREYAATGRLRSLWTQITAANSELIATYPSWMPILQLRYWREVPGNLGDFVVSDKRFAELKHLYLAAFESLARISVLALALDLMASGEGLAVPTKKGSLSIWEFEQLDNANKAPHLAKRDRTKAFAAFLDTKLRNGIGHNAAHYDAATDEVVCVKSRGAGTSEWRISYTGFCYSLLQLMSALVYSEAYVFNILRITGARMATVA